MISFIGVRRNKDTIKSTQHMNNMIGVRIGKNTGGCPNGDPSGLVLTVMSSTRIDLSWTNGSSNESGFSIKRSTDGITFSEIGTALSGATTYSDTSVVAVTKYYYKVCAVKGGCESEHTSVVNDVTEALALRDGNTYAWLDYLRNVTKDGSNLITKWADVLGSGRSVDQVGAARPTWTANGIQFSVTKTLTGVWTIAQPIHFYGVIKQTGWDVNAFIWTGGGAWVYQKYATPGLLASAGSLSVQRDSAIGDLNRLTTNLKGAGSTFYVGLVGGSWASGAGTISSMQIGAANHLNLAGIWRSVSDGAGDSNAIYDYLKLKYGTL